MNYTVYKALNNLANGTTNFNSTVGAVANAVAAVDANYPLNSVQDTLNAISGGHDGWTNNLTTLGDGAWATAYPNISNSTGIAFTQTAQWQYINANIGVLMPQEPMNGDVTVKSSKK